MRKPDERPKNREVEDEMLRPPQTENGPPRPATQPKSAEPAEQEPSRRQAGAAPPGQIREHGEEPTPTPEPEKRRPPKP